jgi:hypothetical protein
MVDSPFWTDQYVWPRRGTEAILESLNYQLERFEASRQSMVGEELLYVAAGR